jgi:hypothetical protein
MSFLVLAPSLSPFCFINPSPLLAVVKNASVYIKSGKGRGVQQAVSRMKGKRMKRKSGSV